MFKIFIIQLVYEVIILFKNGFLMFRVLHFQTAQLLILCRLVRYPLFQFFHFTYCTQCLNLTTVIRDTCSAFVLVFNLSLFNMDFGLPRSSFSRFSSADLNFWNYNRMILSIIEFSRKANLIFRCVCIVTSSNLYKNDIIRSLFKKQLN